MNTDIPTGGLVSNLCGGLGNTLFIAVAGWVGSQILQCPHFLFTYINPDHNHRKHDYTQTVLKYLGTCIQINQEDGVKLAESKGYIHTPYTLPFEGTVDTLQTNMILSGYFQNYSHIHIFEQEIRERVLKGIHDLRESIRKEFHYVDWKNAIFLHIRRGDYLKIPHIHTIQPISYYEKAYATLCQARNAEHSEIFFFSDDMTWVKQQKFFHSLDNSIFIENTDELYCLAIMSLCEGGAICANSTFSWWGAFLGAYAKRAPIYVPHNWINYSGDTSGLIPTDWIRIE